MCKQLRHSFLQLCVKANTSNLFAPLSVATWQERLLHYIKHEGRVRTENQSELGVRAKARLISGHSLCDSHHHIRAIFDLPQVARHHGAGKRCCTGTYNYQENTLQRFSGILPHARTHTSSNPTIISDHPSSAKCSYQAPEIVSFTSLLHSPLMLPPLPLSQAYVSSSASCLFLLSSPSRRRTLAFQRVHRPPTHPPRHTQPCLWDPTALTTKTNPARALFGSTC